MTESATKPTGPSPVAVDLGQSLTALLRRYIDGAHDALEQMPGGPRGFQVLSVAAEGTCGNQATIAEALGLDRTVVTYLVDDLESAGLVERRPDPADRRARQVVLTARGESVHTATSARLGAIERHVLGALTEPEIEVFRSLLARVVGDAPIDRSACDSSEDPC